jgi:hypothetical protein
MVKIEKNQYNLVFLIVLFISMSVSIISQTLGKWALLSYVLIMYFGSWWLIDKEIFEKLFKELDG